MKGKITKIICGILGILISTVAFAQENKNNIAFQKPYSLSPSPNYPHCTDTGDKTQLTDGVYSAGVGSFWTQKTTVGWTSRPRKQVIITIDLGRVEPIKGISFSTAAGIAGVNWPLAIYILASEDGKTFFLVEDLTQLVECSLPKPGVHQTFRYKTDKLETKGRYIRLLPFCPSSDNYVFCDEIEVYRGDASFLNLPYSGEPVTAAGLLSKRQFTQSGCRRRFRLDLKEVKSLIKTSKLHSQNKKKALQETESIAKQIKESDYPNQWEEFKAIVPYNHLHRRIFKLHAKILSAQGFPSLSLWHKHRYVPLTLFEEPMGSFPNLKVTMMQNEYRAEVFNLTNASEEDIKARFQIRGLPKGINPDYVRVYQVEYVDTREGIVVASALTEIEKEANFYITAVPSGMTKQIWLSFHPKKVSPGDYHGSILIKCETLTKEIPLQLSLAPISFPEKPDFCFGMFDYVDACPSSFLGITPQNREAAIKDMNTHFVNVPWGNSWWNKSKTIPWPKQEDIDAEGNLIQAPDFSKFDEWVKMWPDAHYYILLACICPTSSFVGKERGSQIFNKAVSQWAAAWAKHNREIGLKPGQVGIHLIDEPNTEIAFKAILDWARAIKNGTSEISIFIDPTGTQVWDINFAKETLDYCDIICPLLSTYYKGGQRLEDFYDKLQQKGKTLWFYSCSLSPLHLDPTGYYRAQPWHCFLHNAVGSMFWAYGASGDPSSWNEYPDMGKISCTPVYIAPDSITISKHWEAAREGIEDYQYLKMLKDKVTEMKKQGQKNPLLTKASHFLETLPQEVVDKAEENTRLEKEDRSFIDQARIKILRLLIELNRNNRS
ncbi:hypothetical protein KKC91_01080 [bacterium]|nr:hypothetical protein [bacterium]